MKRSFLFVSLALTAAACGDSDGTGAGGGGGGGAGGEGTGGTIEESFPLACDPLVPSYCGFPFPSDVYTVEDGTSPTGKRVAFQPEGLPIAKDGHIQDPSPWAAADGFSGGSALITHFPGATDTNLPDIRNIPASLEDDSPTVLIDYETGERIEHFSEIDKSQSLDENGALLIRPTTPLRDGARYVVAIRGLVDASGASIEPSETFVALRDGVPSRHSSIEDRRPLYDDLFSVLESAGVEREDLLLAWDFTTASRENNTGWLLHMRDEAMGIVGEDGPAYTITSVDQIPDDTVNILYRIKGTMEVPLYLDDPGPGGALIFGEDGMPEPNPDQPTYDAEWELLIPASAANAPARLLQHGHGLLGSDGQIESENFRTFCNEFNYAVFSTELIGMSEDDQTFIADQLVNGQLDTLNRMFDRLHQGFLNNLLIMRMVSEGLANDATYGVYLDPTSRNYWGISQGGIQGGVTMTLSTDIERGVLEVMGQPYNLLLNRSVDFGPFLTFASFQFPDSRARQHLLGLVQMNWDRVEPNGYTKYTFDDVFPGSPPNRRVLMRVAIGDHQVTTFGGHIMARAMNAKHLDTNIRDIHGLEKVGPSVDEDVAVYTEYDFGLPPEPTCNLPLIVCDDPHGNLRKLESARMQNHVFFSTGVMENFCPDQTCDFPELSGCTGREDQDPCD